MLVRAILLVHVCFVAYVAGAQPVAQAKLYYEQTESGASLFADNPEPAPVSFHVDFSLKNMEVVGGAKDVYVVDPNAEHQHLADIDIIDITAASGLSYKSRSNYGNHVMDEHDSTHIYLLPFPEGTKYEVIQGYDGIFTHQNTYALDFDMPDGSTIVAARSGRVVNVVDTNNTNCAELECRNLNNLVRIMHLDGSFAEYTHLQYQSAQVKVGAWVQEGTPIARSGNTGYSSGPHLHFIVYLQELEDQKSVPTLFNLSTNEEPQYLEEGKVYERTKE